MLQSKILINTGKAQLRFIAFSTAVLWVLPVGPVSAHEFDNSIENIFKLGQDDAKYGQLKMNLRYRFEYANAEATPPKPGIGNTLRLRLGYLTPKFYGIQGFAEFEGNLAMQEDYNSLRNGNSGRNVIADPEKAELNQLWISYTGIPGTTVKGGRQRIKIDDDRYIGNVGWRQMEQTYDSVMVTNKSIPNLTIKAGYIGKVKTILSTTDSMETPFGNINYKIEGLGNLIAYGYWINYTDDPKKFKNSSQTYGVRFIGSPKLSDTFTAHYIAEWAKQEDMGKNPIGYDVNRWHLMGGLSAFGVTLKGGMEQLDGQNGKGFSTPLGTNHAFQGWADKFLGTPADGIRDVYASLGGKVAGSKLLFVYHNFKDDTGKMSYGDEYDFLIRKKFGKHYHLLAKYAFYDADGLFTDTQKVWIQGGVNF